MVLVLVVGVISTGCTQERLLRSVPNHELTAESDIRRYEQFMELKRFKPDLEWPPILADFDIEEANRILDGPEIYGYWCGAGHYPKNPDGSVNRNHPSQDALDEVCKQHDLCYFDNCDHWCPCDAVLLRDLPQVSCPHEACETYRVAMISAFSVKPGIVCYKNRRTGVTWSQNGVGGACPNVISRCPNGCPHISR
jgi:hypothetical protein